MKKPLLSELTLREKIGQTINMSPKVMASVTDIDDFFKKNPYGSMWTCGHIKMDFVNLAEEIANADNIDYEIDEKIRKFCEQASKNLKVPFISVVGAERGCRPLFPFFNDTPSNNGIAATRDPQAAYEIAASIARELKMSATYWNWAPVCDNNSPFRASSLTRGFSSDVDLSIEMTKAYVEGTQSENVAACLKHFPGGDSFEYRDTHFSEALINDSYDVWWERQGRIFQAGIEAGVYSIMIDHEGFPAVDGTKIGDRYTPSTMSKKIVTELLKEKMGYKGVVITDAVGMRSLTSMFTTLEDYYVALYNAGNDVILAPPEEECIDVIENAVKKGKISESRIDDACQRVLDMKEKLGLFDREFVHNITQEDRQAVKDKTIEVLTKYAPKSFTWVARKNDLVPIKKENIKKVMAVYIGYSVEVLNSLEAVRDEFKKYGATLDICEHIDSEEHMKEIADNYDLILYVNNISPHMPFGGASFFQEKASQFIHILRYGAEKSIGIGTGSPFVYFDWFSTTALNYLNIYTNDAASLRVLVRGLYGEVEFTGQSPYNLNTVDYLRKK